MSWVARLRLLDRWPYWTLAVLAVVFVFMLVFSRKAPVIGALEPAMAAPGQTVAVLGEYFGRTEREGSLTIAGEIPPPSLIQSWSDQKIVFTVPEDVSSGIVTVSNSQGVSPGVLFTNTESIPSVLQGTGGAGVPELWSAVPAAAVAGQTVTLLGRRFGAGDEPVGLKLDLGNGGPSLKWSPAQTVSWTDRQIVFRLPAGSGDRTTVQIVTPQGESTAFAVPATGPVVLQEPRSAEVEFQAQVTGTGAALTLWVPVPDRGTTTVVSAPSTAVPGRPLGLAVPAGNGERTVSATLTLTSWAHRWKGFSAGVAAPSDGPAGSSWAADYLKPAAAALKLLTPKWGLDVPDPFVRLQRLQTGLTATLGAGTAGPGRSAAAVLVAKTASADELALFAAGLATQTGLAARPIAGLVLDDQGRWQPRTWVQIWIPGAGWVDWDPASSGPGDLDNRHFAFDSGDLQGHPSAGAVRVSGVVPGTLALASGEGIDASGATVVWRVLSPTK